MGKTLPWNLEDLQLSVHPSVLAQGTLVSPLPFPGGAPGPSPLAETAGRPLQVTQLQNHQQESN